MAIQRVPIHPLIEFLYQFVSNSLYRIQMHLEKTNLAYLMVEGSTVQIMKTLNPFLYFPDKHTYGAGNPFLSPMFSNVLELSHTYKQFLTTTLNYSHTKDLLTETL
jgi:hypothetical protein